MMGKPGGFVDKAEILVCLFFFLSICPGANC